MSYVSKLAEAWLASIAAAAYGFFAEDENPLVNGIQRSVVTF